MSGEFPAELRAALERREVVLVTGAGLASVSEGERSAIPALMLALAASPWPIVVTTATDDAWARALGAEGAPVTVLSAGQPLDEELRAEARLLIHVFGRATEPASLCRGADDVEAKVVATGLGPLLADVAQDLSFLFVGFDAESAELGWLVGPVLRLRPGEGRTHHVLCPGGRQEAAWQRLGLEPIAVGASTEEVLAKLAGVAAEVASEPAEAAASAVPAPAAVAPEEAGASLEGRCAELHATLDRATEAERWSEAADALDRLLELEPAPLVRASYLHAAALIHRDHLGAPSKAAALLTLALEAAPALRPAREALVRLWDGVAERAGTSPGDPETAAAALEVAGALAPDHPPREERLAALYLEAGASARDKAIAAHQRLCARTPERAAPYRELASLWAATGESHRLYWACAVLEHLGAAEDQHRRALTRGRAAQRAAADPPLSAWPALAHPDEDAVLSAFFAIVGPRVAHALGWPQIAFREQHGEPRPRPGPAVGGRPQRASSGVDFPARALGYVADVLGLAPPALHLVRGTAAPLDVHNVTDRRVLAPAFLLDPTFAVDAGEDELMFVLARAAALLRPAWLIRHALPTPRQLRRGLRAGWMLAGIPQLVDPADEIDPDPLPDQIRRPRLEPHVRATLAELARRLATGEPPDLGRWLGACELSAARAALLVVSDLGAAVRTLVSEGDRGPLPARERVKDLLAFAVSEEHFAARWPQGAAAGDAP